MAPLGPLRQPQASRAELLQLPRPFGPDHFQWELAVSAALRLDLWLGQAPRVQSLRERLPIGVRRRDRHRMMSLMRRMSHRAARQEALTHHRRFRRGRTLRPTAHLHRRG